MTDRAAVPLWYWILAVALLLWGAMGIYSFYTELTTSYDQLAASMGKAEADAIANMPQWLWWVFGAAVWSGAFGSLALLLRSAWARPLYLISLVSVVVQFGYTFLMTSFPEAVGAHSAIFPGIIILVAGFELWFANWAKNKRWIG